MRRPYDGTHRLINEYVFDGIACLARQAPHAIDSPLAHELGCFVVRATHAPPDGRLDGEEIQSAPLTSSALEDVALRHMGDH